MKLSMRLASLVVLFFLCSHSAWAQGCSMCTKTASELGADAAKGLNTGILYLAFLPLSMMLIVFILWRRGSFKV